MKPDLDSDELDQMLALGRLGGPKREQLLRGALAGLPRKRRAWWWALAGAPALAALGLVALWIVPHARNDGFAAKGTPAQTALEALCDDGQLARCGQDHRLVFRVTGAQQGGYLSALATRRGAPASERIWFFPTASGATPAVAPGTGTELLHDAIPLAGALAPGVYEVELILSLAPLQRDDIRAGTAHGVIARVVVPIEVLP
jgi:hypothetical protein